MEQSFSEWKVAEISGPGKGRGGIFRNYGLRRIPKAVRQWWGNEQGTPRSDQNRWGYKSGLRSIVAEA